MYSQMVEVSDYTTTFHAHSRQKQRGIPPLIAEWLVQFGKTTYLGGGVRAKFFTKKTIQNLKKAVGELPVRRLSDHLNCYLILDSQEQIIITMGKRFKKTRFREKWAKTHGRK